MSYDLLQDVVKMQAQNRRRKAWRNLVRTMAFVVVFITTYALILPAITMEKETVCGAVEHEHSEQCYQVQPVTHLICQETLPEKILHVHDDYCMNSEGKRVCALNVVQQHIHTDDCYAQKTVKTCRLAEVEAHSHTETCYQTLNIPCSLPEHEEHTPECSTELIVQTCTLTETPGHTHDETCHQEETVQICGLPQTAEHSHEDGCYDAKGSLTCQIIPATIHQHDEGCWEETEEATKLLICQMPIHLHHEGCYPDESSDGETNQSYLCGNGEHRHEKPCYGADGSLKCTIPVHAHQAACVVAGVDLTAVEYAYQWQASVRAAQRTGYWPEDVIEVAKTQLGYEESTKNLVLTDGVLMGYTRYGDWYGIPYGDWCAMFVSFCLDHAGVTDFPLEASCERWIAALKEQNLYQEAANYDPKVGDVIFFKQKSYTELSDHIGLVAEIIPATEATPAQIRTIEGNSNDRVQYMTYDLSDATIVGYGVMPAGAVRHLIYEGSDFVVTVSFDADAGIPENAALAVRELEAGSEEFQLHYRQAVQQLIQQGSAASEEELQVTFARFFDIHFVADGVVYEPTKAVNIQITYTDTVTMGQDEAGVAVHFADTGIEVLEANTDAEANGTVDTFQFSQNSFSVTGTIIAKAAVNTSQYHTQDVTSVDGSGGTEYALYFQRNGKYYVLEADYDNGKVYAIEVTVDAAGNITNGQEKITNRMRWTFQSQSDGGFLIYNKECKRYLHAWGGTNVTASGAYTSFLEPVMKDGVKYFRVRSNSDYASFNGSFSLTQNADQAILFRLAAVQNKYHVWFDGTNGGLMGLYGSDNTYQSVNAGSNTITLPATWKSPTKYTYKLNGWYDINNDVWYAPGATVTITQNTVFYADWVAQTYDVGFDNEYAVASLDTNSFITTYVFDYNSLFNVQSMTHTGSITSSGHSESWSMVNSGQVSYNDANTLKFVFVDYDANGDFSYPNGRDVYNVNQSIITEGVLEMVDQASKSTIDNYLLELLFNPELEVIGKNYVGTGNYLYQYMDSTTSNYDGHDGYYYFHSRLNAASYNQKEQRFYLYSYLERTTDSWKDKGAGEFSDFLPFNSPYANVPAGQKVNTYTADTRQMGYQFDAKDSYNEYSAYGNAGTNYWFGIRSDIEFFLPNDAGDRDEYGNYGNISTRGQHMVFEFHGDDDVWVFVDGVLMLDVGGVHGIEYGEIDFSTGVVSSGDGDTLVTRTFEEILGKGKNIEEGTHVLTVYYMERGSSQSNCSIYFNVAPRYDLEITKEDVFTAEELDGAVFAIYNDEACTELAQLWSSRKAYDEDMDDNKVDNTITSITVQNGVAACWGLSAGKTYYIKEIQPPAGYPANDDIIRITLNNRGTATIETTTLHGPDGDEAKGFAVIKQNVNETLKIVALTVTNQKDTETTELHVEKQWAEGSTNLPEYITVYLTLNGKRVGRTATLSEQNGWAYTWTGLPLYATDASGNQIMAEYQVEEVLVPNFTTDQISRRTVVKEVNWYQTDRLEDSMTYLLVHNGKAMAYKNGGFSWINIEDAKSDTSAQWSVTTDHHGFRVENGNGYAISLNNSNNFYGDTTKDSKVNQVLYFADSQLMAQHNDVYYIFGQSGQGVTSDGLVFSLYRKTEVTGVIVEIENKPVQEDAQTHVEVSKVWTDDKDHSKDSITIHLYGDGKDTGRELVLSKANNWQGSFEDLPYYGDDGATPIAYTVVEKVPLGYSAEYTTATVSGRPTTVWAAVTNLAEGQTIRLSKGSYALASADTGAAISKPNDLNDAYQQWKVVKEGKNLRLQNVATGKYLKFSEGELTTVNTAKDGSDVIITSGMLQIASKHYLILSGSTLSLSQHSYNGTLLTVTQKSATTEKPGLSITVTNSKAEYTMPATGGIGTQPFTFGGLFLITAALMYIFIPAHKKNRRGDRG